MKINFIDFIRGRKSDGKFFNASEAYQRTRYNDNLTKEELKEKIIKELQRRIISNFKNSKRFLDITTYDSYREKLLLPEIADYFRELNYRVDLLNSEGYQDVNVLIINWQDRETIK